ncbi:4-(cytidine 5'-diphospho)-2-C-methyl-D-erythritol kinase [Nitratidesulfovibrio sp. SRB-5]|uniref:4-(cytidine 5'-diphospho)-2-C-methyl-D-erythritol kinase n=1 Tax=Nitratidesulfovibrio sp. SRB-5 TaxID=2872636 RepID=UPI00102634ED|nr:4-(cytidine 5'-diphospho)-2-C-methyl-D-erythritol kinase [Nitratidesulfovibrio sp. SRB-5]MBZ2171874.1 4-(cytidine 5'-diphospho)-2-C-methyl-D-erythritol kinase [Nitratidesulfovibrio sp. SRB-5]RXF77498.1 4-(cytidine 5'-diphospho)-2-C-methyl-D-erythritol kinase [Desulfovibrio sp. DS-1]
MSTHATPAPGAVTLHAGCKVNLYLRITGVRPDGYHELDTLFLPLPEPCDLLHVSPRAEAGIVFTCTEPDVDPARNTVVTAYERFATATGFRPGLAVHLEKHIPHGAGLGGGSADAAVLLRHLAALCAQQAPGAAPTPEVLRAMAAGVGADVPFFLMDGPARANGIGEVLTPLAPGELADLGLAGMHLVLACPPVRVSTPWAYRAWDAANVTTPDGNAQTSTRTSAQTSARIMTGQSAKSLRPCLTSESLEDRNPLSRGPWLTNSFEPVVFQTHATLRRTKEFLLRRGACAALMSGSGASLFALFRKHGTARDVAEALRNDNIAAFLHAL